MAAQFSDSQQQASLSYESLSKVTDALSQITQYTYDAADNTATR